MPAQKSRQASRRNQCTAGAYIFLGASLKPRYQNEKDFWSAEERHSPRRPDGSEGGELPAR